ncbi:MAG: PRD domain-containing protein [Clostridium sp.]
MPYDQIKLEEEKLLLLKQYEPIGVIGVMNPYISGVPFIYLHELTAEYAEPKIYSIFSSVAEPEQIADIVKNLVRNLFLDRLIGNITILDGSRLLINISNCLDYYEQITEHSLSNRIRYCLYFHISCLVERLIRKEPITTCGNLEYFIQTEQTAIQNIKSSFSELETAYGIDIPDAEIKYLSDILLESH